jgi:hypothetical protein
MAGGGIVDGQGDPWWSCAKSGFKDAPCSYVVRWSLRTLFAIVLCLIPLLTVVLTQGHLQTSSGAARSSQRRRCQQPHVSELTE